MDGGLLTVGEPGAGERCQHEELVDAHLRGRPRRRAARLFVGTFGAAGRRATATAGDGSNKHVAVLVTGGSRTNSPLRETAGRCGLSAVHAQQIDRPHAAARRGRISAAGVDRTCAFVITRIHGDVVLYYPGTAVSV